jgi:hypothetical protein
MGFIAEKLLQMAMEDGEFDDLQGKGKPFIIEDDPFMDSASRLAYSILKNAGIKPVWLELDHEIGHELQEVQRDLAFALEEDRISNSSKRGAIRCFRKRLEELNERIRYLNLKVPHPRLQRMVLIPDEEVKRLLKDLWMHYTVKEDSI